MEPLEASASLRERLARLKIASRRRTARAGGVGVSDEPTDENRVVPSETRSKPFTLTDDDDVRAAPATFSRDRPDALRANRRAARPAADEGAADGTTPRAFAASTELRSHGTTRGHRVDDALGRKTPATKDAASEPAPATVAILRAVPLDAPGKEHVPFAAVTKTRGAVELVTTRPKTTLRKTRRFDAAVNLFLHPERESRESETMNGDAASLDAAASLASHEGGFGLARDARAAVRDGVGSAFLFFGNRAGVSRVARGWHGRYPRDVVCKKRPGNVPRDRSLVVPETDLGFAGLVAEALFREIAAARADAPDGVEFVVTLQVLADVIVAPAGAASAESASAGRAKPRTPSAFGLTGLSRAKTREVLRDALAEGFDDAVATADADESANDDAVRGGRGAGSASAAAAFFCQDASRPTRPRVREDVDAFRNSSSFFVENAVEVVVDTLDTCRACLARAFRGVARLEAEMASPTSPTSEGERAHVLARFDVLTRRFANATIDATTVSTVSTKSSSVTHGNAVPEFPESNRKTNDGLDDDDDEEVFVLPFSETRASLWVCDFAGTGGNRGGRVHSDGRARTVPEDAALKAFFRVTDAARENASHAPFRDSNVTKLLSSALGGGDRLRCCFGARDGVAADASPTEKKSSFENLDATLARAETVAEAFAQVSSRKKSIRSIRFARREMAAAKRAVSELGRVALGREDALAAGLRSTDIQLDMDGSDALVALRDALARLERARRDARRVVETREATERLFARFGMC